MAPLCLIKLESENPAHKVFLCGDRLRCNITLNLDKPRIMKGVFVTISGSGKCNWSERHTYGDISVTTHYAGQEGYIDSVTYLVGSTASDVSELPAGIHTYSFVYDIPSHLPSSIEGEKGHIRYDVRVTINRPFPLLDDNFKQDFILIRPLNLNGRIAELGIPSEIKLNHTFCCYSCRSAPLNVVASVTQTGFVPGQQIKVKIEANNGSNVTISSIKTSLCQIIEYFSVAPRDGKWVQLKNVTLSLIAGVPANQTKNYEIALNVPSVPPTDEESSKIIHVTYCIKLKFNTNWFHTSPTVFIPIAIGTVPLGHNTDQIVVEDIYDSPVRFIKEQPDENRRDTLDEIFKK